MKWKNNAVGTEASAAAIGYEAQLRQMADAMAGIERDNRVSAQANVSEANVKSQRGVRSHNPLLRSVPPAGRRSPDTEPRTGSFSA